MLAAARQLRGGDTLYRVLRPNDPPEYEGDVPLPFGFMEKSRTAAGPSGTLSFFAASHVSPADALGKVSKNRLARERCGTGKAPPSPALMYHCGYRVAALRAAFVIEACDDRGNDLALETDREGNTVGADGHVEVFRGDFLADQLSQRTRILTKEETFPET